MLVIYIAALLGILRFRTMSYWKWVGILFGWMFGAQFLFAGGGTLDDPSGDGLIAHQIRIATNDGPGMGLFALLFIITYWGGAIWIMRKAYVVGRQFEEEREAEEAEEINAGRKALEAIGLTIIAGIYIYVSFVLPRRVAQDSPPTITVDSPAQSEASDPIARELAATAEQMTREGPKKLDLITTLASVSAEGRILTYHYELSRRDGSDEGLRAFARKNAVTSACKNADMLSGMKDYGVTYRYSYMFPNAAAPVIVDATYSECTSLKSGRQAR
jgi:hypothetical protein